MRKYLPYLIALAVAIAAFVYWRKKGGLLPGISVPSGIPPAAAPPSAVSTAAASSQSTRRKKSWRSRIGGFAKGIAKGAAKGALAASPVGQAASITGIG